MTDAYNNSMTDASISGFPKGSSSVTDAANLLLLEDVQCRIEVVVVTAEEYWYVNVNSG